MRLAGVEMAKRERAALATPTQSYFVGEKPNYSFISSGCAILDCVLGGGFPLGRITNLVGDKSTSKTGLATEVLINFIRQFPNGKPAYRDTEAAFDLEYAAAMGLDRKKIDLGDPDKPITTIEDFIREFDGYLTERAKTKTPGMYVIDSLDALSDEAEMERDVGDKSYGMAKPKLLSEFFRKTARKIETSQVHLLIVSQVRDNIGAMFGEKYKRSGGKALDFYASQCLWLAHIETLKKEINKIKRPYAIEIRAKCKKNKVGLPLRECDFVFRFGFGVEDAEASADWLKAVGRLKDAEINVTDYKAYRTELDDLSAADYDEERKRLAAVVKKVWSEIEISFLPKRTKYQ
jgi:recombination protein RecA